MPPEGGPGSASDAGGPALPSADSGSRPAAAANGEDDAMCSADWDTLSASSAGSNDSERGGYVSCMRCTELPSAACTAAPNVLQRTYFDCGIACAASVLGATAARRRAPACPSPPAPPPEELPPLSRPLPGLLVDSAAAPQLWGDLPRIGSYYAAASGGNCSVWTVDLFFLMRQLLAALWGRFPTSDELNFSATALTVNPDYSRSPYYRDCFSVDAGRVGRLFSLAAQQQGALCCRAIPTRELAARLRSGRELFIVLVDATHLRCQCFLENELGPGCRCSGMFIGASSDYQGHYVVLKGVDVARRVFLYGNPASRCPTCQSSFRNFSCARRAYGTDNDVLAVCIDGG